MLSRRSVRVKVMQVLYALSKDEHLKAGESDKVYWDYVDHTYELYLFSLYVLSRIARVASDDEEKRKSKHLPTEEDKMFTDKLSSNDLVKSLRENNALVTEFEKRKFNSLVDGDHVTNIYNEFAKSPLYLEYIKNGSSAEDHIEILLELFRHCRKSDLYKEMMQDRYVNWTDDKSMVIGTVKKVIKSLPIEKLSEIKQHYPDDETVKEFGLELLDKTIKGDAYFLELIQPILEHWDSDRLATIDMILLKMAACEMLYFNTIPLKVTLNEYVEIAKTYSTDKSREFVNGVLDRLMKLLEEKELINKTGRGLN